MPIPQDLPTMLLRPMTYSYSHKIKPPTISRQNGLAERG